MGWETTTALLLDSSFSSGMSLDAWETSSGGNVSSDNGLLCADDISSSGNIRNSQKPGGGVTVRVVGTGCGTQTSGELGGSHGGGGESKDKEKHLDWLMVFGGAVAQSICKDSTSNSNSPC